MSRIALDTDLTRRLARQGKKDNRSVTNLANLLLRRHYGMKASPPKKAK